MPTYSNSKIYMIRNRNATFAGYIGCTTKQYLSSKLASDIIAYQQYKLNKTDPKSKNKLYELFDLYGYQNCNIVLIEHVNCKNKDELNTKLYEVINKTPNCVNYKYIPSEELQLPDACEQVNVEPVVKVKRQPLNDENHMICPCGGRCTVFNTKQHSLTKKHKKYLDEEKQKQLLTDNILSDIVEELQTIGDAIIAEQLLDEQIVDVLIEPVIEVSINGEIKLLDEEELKHLENCQYRDYDQDIRSWKD